MDIPQLSAVELFNQNHPNHKKSLSQLKTAAEDIGFLTLTDTELSANDVSNVLDVYREFFKLPVEQKSHVDMANTESNRGWGAPGAEQVDPASNPDYKEVFDCGPELNADDPITNHIYYAANRWPDTPEKFQAVITEYFTQATRISLNLLIAIARSIGESEEYFVDKFDKPMALLRGNFYGSRPANSTELDFGIAPHTDYGCLTFLATDGSPGLEIETREGKWVPINAEPGTFVINFGEMIQMWTEGRVVATPHRVIGGSHERQSIPLFFNPRFDVNVAPQSSDQTILAGEHLSRRYDETYLHRQVLTKND